MCGIFGLLNNNANVDVQHIIKSFEKGSHRGPEFSIYKKVMVKTDFGFHRLAINGLDEISPYAKTNIIQLKDGQISEISIDPKSLNVNAEKFENLIGDDAKFNADKMINIFKGEDNDFSKAVCLNAAAGLIVGEKCSEFSEAYSQTREHILSGKTFQHLEKIQNA